MSRAGKSLKADVLRAGKGRGSGRSWEQLLTEVVAAYILSKLNAFKWCVSCKRSAGLEPHALVQIPPLPLASLLTPLVF
jgi:hypothetical protein